MLTAVLSVLLTLAADPVSYAGRQVTVVDPGTQDPDGFFPKGEAKVCVQGRPEEACYKAPKLIGRAPKLSVVELRRGEPALFFEAESGGVSGFALHFALLEFCNRDQSRGCGVDELRNLLPSELEVSNQSQNAWWDLPELSDSKAFLTADGVWGPRESHYGDHRFIVSAYVRRPDDFDELTYYLVDQFMTVRFYGYTNPGQLDDVLGPEKLEIVERLKRVKASWDRLVEPKQ